MGNAVVALKPGQTASDAELRDHVRANLARYKVPKRFVFVEDVPKNAAGKILRTEACRLALVSPSRQILTSAYLCYCRAGVKLVGAESMGDNATASESGERKKELAQAAGEIRLRQKSQITLPTYIVRRLGLQEGDRLVVEVREDDPEAIRLRPIRSDYAGALAGIYGSADEVRLYFEGEREAWGK